MPLGPDETTDAHWEIVKRFIGLHGQINKVTEGKDFVELFKVHWKSLNDVPKMQAVLDSSELSQLEEIRDTQDTGRPQLDDRITELEEKTR